MYVYRTKQSQWLKVKVIWKPWFMSYFGGSLSASFEGNLKSVVLTNKVQELVLNVRIVFFSRNQDTECQVFSINFLTWICTSNRNVTLNLRMSCVCTVFTNIGSLILIFLSQNKSAESLKINFHVASFHAHQSLNEFVILRALVFHSWTHLWQHFQLLYSFVAAKPSSASNLSPKSSASVEGPDGEDDRSVGSPGPKVPPLKIVIPPVESEQGSRTGKNTTRHHPYVVVSNDETSTAVSMVTTSPSSPAVHTMASKEEAHSLASASLTSEEQRSKQRVLRSANRYCKNSCWCWRHIFIIGCVLAVWWIFAMNSNILIVYGHLL